MKTAHPTKGSAQKAAFRHALKERDEAISECRRLKSISRKPVQHTLNSAPDGKRITHLLAGDSFVDTMRSIQGQLSVAVQELHDLQKGGKATQGDEIPAIRSIWRRLDILNREFEQTLPAVSAKSAEPSAKPIHKGVLVIPPGAPPLLVPSPCFLSRNATPTSQVVPSLTISRQSSVHTLSNPFQAHRIPTPATTENAASLAQHQEQHPQDQEVQQDQPLQTSEATEPDAAPPAEEVTIALPLPGVLVDDMVVEDVETQSNAFAEDLRDRIDEVFADFIDAPAEIPVEIEVESEVNEPEVTANEAPCPPPRSGRQTVKEIA
ncbi:hypothetical protein HKX48_002514 [Thoreauomyces humboldtii]|nr:hypothetical protein HKX48_002514 [Thoreauomyces humboldtii]